MDVSNAMNEPINYLIFAQCNCCPYGFHIDLDFIRFCENMTTGVRRRPVSEARRARRRQTSSMEVMLGLIPALPVSQNLPSGNLASPGTPSRKVAIRTPLPTIPQESKDSAKVDGELYDVLGRFEATLEESKSRHASPANSLSRNSRLFLMSADWHDVSPVRRTGSSSSLSSIPSSASSYRNSLLRAPLASPEKSIVDLSISSVSQPAPDDAMSVASTCSTVNVLTLQAIREQLATSLERMKELEEQVKTIPILQVKLSVVEEEKRQLSQQLKNCPDFTPIESSVEKRDESQQTIESKAAIEVDRIPKKGLLIERGLDPIVELLPEKVSTSEVGISSTPIMHHICVGEPRLMSDASTLFTKDVRTVGTETIEVPKVFEKPREVRAKPCLKCFQQSLKRFNSVETNTDFEANNNDKSNLVEDYKSYVKYSLAGSSMLRRMSQVRMAPPKLTFDNSTNTESIKMCSSLCETDLKSSDIKTDKDIQAAIDDFQKVMADEQRLPCVDSAVQCNVEPQRIVQVVPPLVKTADASAQVSKMEKNFVRSVGVSCKPELIHKFVTAKPLTRDTASSDSSINDKFCNLCSKKSVRHIGVGAFHINDTWCEKCSAIKSRSIGVGDYKVNETYCDKCKKVQTRSVAIGDNSVFPSEICPDKPSLRDCSTDSNDLLPKSHAIMSSIHVQTETDDECEKRFSEGLSNDRKSASPAVKPPFIPSRIPKLSQTIQIPPSETSECSYTSTNSGARSPIMAKGSNPRTRLALPLPRSAPNSPLIGRKEVQKPAAKISTASFVAGLMNSPFEEDIQSEPGGRHGSGNSLDKMTRNMSKRAISEPEAGLSDFSEDESETLSESDTSEGTETEIKSTPLSPSKSRGQKALNEIRRRVEPSKEMKAALKVLNDSLSNSKIKGSRHLTAATNIISQEWFTVTSKKEANPKIVEDYLDELEAVSRNVLAKVVNMTDANGNTAMHYAVSHGNFSIVSLLLDTKVCDSGKPNRAGYTPIMLVCLAPIATEEHKLVVKRLFNDVDINARACQHGQTALMLAVSHGRLDMVMLLVAVGADINIQDVDGSSALMCAAEHGHIDIIKFLIAQPDCDINLKDNDGSTALSISVEAGHRDIGVLLYAHATFKRGEAYPAVRLARRSSKGSTPGSLSPTGSRTGSVTLT
ncbi:KN motif and ankyrin repeat domain-containing protein 1-like isoform X2 [Artemia franciscana]|uniref:KN motif and ankyrin repeat domain-containing protein 1-like isoform X2 n=1 Tax=Artemia franciscana TaxID=6661 RepID=UPI0032DBB1C3